MQATQIDPALLLVLAQVKEEMVIAGKDFLQVRNCFPS